MSLIPRNSFFNELRKAFRLLEEPFLHHNRSVPAPRRKHPQSDLFKASGLDNLDALSGFSGAYVKEAEDGKNYLVEAELPGVKKENIKVDFSDNGEVLHIEGFKGALPVSSSSSSAGSGTDTQPSTATAGDARPAATSNETAVEKANENSTSVIPDWAKESYSYGSFHETFRFPSAVDVDKVQASYEDGVLRLTIPKTEKDIARKSVQIT